MVEKINWRITYKCNMRPYCKFCFMPHGHFIDNSEITWKIANRIIDYSPKMVVISGGEPTMVNQLNSIIALFDNKGIKVCLATNAIRLDKIHEIYKQIDTITLPIDLLSCHNNLRNNPCIKNVDILLKNMDKLSILNDIFPRIIINTVLYNQGYEDLKIIARYIRQYPISVWKIFEYIHRIGINPPMHNQKLNEIEKTQLRKIIGKIRLSYEDINNKNARYFMVNPDGQIVMPINITQNIYNDLSIGSIFDSTLTIEKIWRDKLNQCNYNISNKVLDV